MWGELGGKGLGPAEEAVAPHSPEPTTTSDDAGKASGGSAVPNSCEFGVKEEPVEEDGSLGQAGNFCGEEIDEKAEMVSGGLGELLAPDQLLTSGISDLAVKEDVSEGAVAMEMVAAPTDVETNTAVSAKEEGGGDKEEHESSEDESDSSEEEDESSEGSSSSEDEEEQRSKKDVDSSEALSSSDEEEELGVKMHSGAGGTKGGGLEALLEEGELMIGSDEEGDEPKGPIKSKHEAEVLPPVPKIEIQLEPHHQTLPVGTISAVMGERVIVEGSVQHNPLNEGSILWLTEIRTPLGIVDELFGPVKNPYYLVRYNSEEEVPGGISVGTSVSFIAEFADHILNMKELYAKGYDASGDNDEVQEDELEFSDDEKEAEFKRSLHQAKRQTDRQHEPNKPSGDKKRSQPRGAGFRKDMPPRNRETLTPGHQSQPRFQCSDRAPAVAENMARSLGPQNISMRAPTMLPPPPTNPAMPSPVHLANQMGGCFMNPVQFLPQQSNMIWPGRLPPPPHPNMGVEGAALAANIMQNLLAGANQFRQQFQNQNFGGFPNQMAMPFPQFMPQTGVPANPMPFGGPPVNSPFGSAPQVPMGQGNFGQPPHMAGDRQEQGHPPGFPANSQGFANLAQPHGDGEQPPAQFHSGKLNQGSSSFRCRRPQQHVGRHSSGRGASASRGGRHRR
ncbi:H/ACA ribonucleoprotein complex non-core subunit NAF1-like [Phragmites australis]|uniref:H/ACA ribonucleoprotein complex non-core subunit NAF1-like n=1 Tax=Phragmites australis TaxID=29695 RepID=UPI002D771EC6|nr:H/ACA ribonucleoprotein complex non-core subunit NAF1-like [Phragmites australis]